MIRVQVDQRNRSGKYIALAIVVVIAGLWLLERQWPKLAWINPFVAVGAVCVRQLFVRQVSFVGDTSDKGFKWLANVLVLLLIVTYCTGYVLLASVAHFSLSVVAVFATAIVISALSGMVLRRYISSHTMLAYGLTFTAGIFLAGLMLFFVVGHGRTLAQMS